MPNELGIYDMSGNVWEWCYDLYDYYKILSVSDPKGPEKGDGRIVRGGSWYIEAQNARCCYRSHRKPGTADKYIGFRLAASN
jgi:formylglycine-generating enzyme required for sulfatase activity